MLKAPVFSRDGKKIGEVDLPEEVFGFKPKRHVLWEVVRAYLANRRVGTAKAKTRAEVKGSGRKIWPQKGNWTRTARRPSGSDFRGRRKGLPTAPPRLWLRSSQESEASCDENGLIGPSP